jgi:hypothetical protein
MANFYGQARSNYFAVKDADAFLEEMKKYPVEIITEEKDGVTLYGFLDADSDGAGDVFSYYDEELGEGVDVDWQRIFMKHLADDYVAIIVSVGTEKYRYFSGGADAYNNKGQMAGVSIEDIYKVASHLGSNITRADY